MIIIYIHGTDLCPGKNDQEDCAAYGVYILQIQKTAAHQTMQALWIGRRQEEEGK